MLAYDQCKFILINFSNNKQYYQFRPKSESPQLNFKRIDNEITNGKSPAWDKYLKEVKTK